MLKAIELKKEFDSYNQGIGAVPAWTMTKEMLIGYSNEYITVIRMDSSNKWLGEPHNSLMGKMWSIIVDIKKNFTYLSTYRALLQAGFNIKVTPVATGKNKGKYGIRIYNMKKEPNEKLVRAFLDFLFI
jgi:hypothetical protein